jgi:hypothetical protein
LRVDHRLHLDAGVGEEAAHLTQGDRADTLHAGDPAALA